MATATAKKPRVDTEAVSQLSALPERVGIVETKVESIKEQIIHFKGQEVIVRKVLDLFLETFSQLIHFLIMKSLTKLLK